MKTLILNFFAETHDRKLQLLVFCVYFSWIYSLDSGRLKKKYKLQPIKFLKGTTCDMVFDDDFAERVNSDLEKAGILDEEDRIFVMNEMKKLATPNPQYMAD